MYSHVYRFIVIYHLYQYLQFGIEYDGVPRMQNSACGYGFKAMSHCHLVDKKTKSKKWVPYWHDLQTILFALKMFTRFLQIHELRAYLVFETMS